MKIRLLLTVAALAATSLSFTARAGSWVAPTVPGGKTIESGSIYYIYNTSAGQFLTEGNDWGTRASLASTGLRFKVTSIGSLSDGSAIFTLQVSSVVKKAWKFLFIADSLGSYVDMGNQGHQYWCITPTTVGD